MKSPARTVAVAGRTIEPVAGDVAVPGAGDPASDSEAARFRSNNVATVAVITMIGYYFGSLFGLSLQLIPSTVSSLWPPNALLLAVLLLTSRRHWWIFLAAAFPAHLLAHSPLGVPLAVMVVQFASNALQAAFGAIAFQYFAGERPAFDRLKTVVSFIAIAGLAVPALVAVLATGLFDALGWKEDSWTTWRIRFQSNGLAVLTITPLVVHTWSKRASLTSKLSLHRTLEAAALGAGLFFAGYWISATPGSESQGSLPLLYLPVPLLLLASVRFGLVGACLAILTLTSVTVWGAFHAAPVPSPEPVERALAFGLFLLVTAIPLLLLASLLEERNRAELAAHDMKDELQKLMESTAAIPWQADPATSALTYIGPQVADIYGYSQDDWQRRGFWLSRLHPDDRKMVRSIYETATQTTESFNFDFRIVDAHGNVRWAHSTVRCEHRDGKPFQLRGFIIDITERRRAESQERRHRAEIMQLNRVASVGEFAASITHEIFQPLGAILNSAEAAEMFLDADPPALDDAREMLADIRKDDQRAVEIIRRTRNLLQKHEIVLSPVDLNALIDETLGLLSTEAESRIVRVRFEPDANLPPVSGDRIHLQQVITNLALNAFDAMDDLPDDQRQLRIQTSRNGNGEATVTVSDTGTGIVDERLPKLFQPLFTTKRKGLGMGLSITRTIVEAHHGRIRAANNRQGGASFTIDLPVFQGNTS
jgi:PAS domain S-box-containing protein